MYAESELLNLCLADCDSDEKTCVRVCSRALQIAERARGTPMNVPFPAPPMIDLPTFPGPSLENWAADPLPSASFAPWVPVPAVPWPLGTWNGAGPPLSATLIQDSEDRCKRQCYEACSLEADLTDESRIQGLAPMPGTQLRCAPTELALTERSGPPPAPQYLGPGNSILIHGEPVVFTQSLPTFLPLSPECAR